MQDLPVPRDIPLPLPFPRFELEIALIVLFLLHILFVNLMVGGSLLGLAYEIAGLKRKDYERLARAVAKTITVNKSLAVVLGVAPLLLINLLYTVHFYSANALTGTAWIMIVPLVTIAFILTYAHEYSWDCLAGNKGLHITLGGTATALFLVIPFIFLTNINLMLFPGQWPHVRGFLSALILPNVLPRYLHFLLASVAVTGLFLAWYLGRAKYPVEKAFEELDRPTLRRQLLSVGFGATAAQLLAGPLLFFTLPAGGMSWWLAASVILGVSAALAALAVLWRQITLPRASLGGSYWVVVALLGSTVLFMGSARHLYRERSLAPHRARIAERSASFERQLLGAKMREAAGTPRAADEEGVSPGERTFRSICMGCHAQDTRLVGPPVTEITRIYAGNPDGLIAWVRSPGRKRPDYPQMPPIRLTDDQYRAVAAYILGP